MAKLIKKIIILLVAVGLAGCDAGSNQSDLEKLVADLQKQAVKAENLIDNFHFMKAVDYPDTVRNPFPETSQSKEVAVNANSPLEQYPLDTLNLLGIIQQGTNNTAVILAPDSKMYQVTVGDKIGINHGTVEKITDTQVVVSEPVNAELGDAITHTKILQLKEQ